jgi:Glutaredoxin-like domain (DUF836)
MSATPPPDLILYTRPGCGLCDETRDLLTSLLAERAIVGRHVPTIVERDIETDPTWEREFFALIPVVELADRRLELATSAMKLRRFLSAALD